MKLKFLHFFDFILFISVISLVTIGILFIYSSGINSDHVNVSKEYIKQIIWASIGIVIMVGISLLDYRKIQRYSLYLFIFSVGILIFTKFFGRYVNGARSWLGFGPFGIQPSEFCKIIYIIFLANFLDKSKTAQSQLKRFIKALFIMAIPMGLILLQPDLGTSLVYFPILLAMCYIADIPIRYIMLLFLIVLLSFIFAVLPIWEERLVKHPVLAISVITNLKLRLIMIIAFGAICIIGMIGKIIYRHNAYYYWISYIAGVICASLVFSYIGGKVLKEYQVMRLIVFLNPNADRLGAGWNIIQSKIAIGSGNFFGQGFLKGTQSHYRFLPEQSTDFIFSILSEEFGFIGGMIVFSLYFVILLRTIYIIKNTNFFFGNLIASGIFAIFFFHFIINVGMVMGIMPITGIPLLFLSYGGSSLWTAMICIGLLMSIGNKKNNF